MTMTRRRAPVDKTSGAGNATGKRKSNAQDVRNTSKRATMSNEMNDEDKENENTNNQHETRVSWYNIVHLFYELFFMFSVHYYVMVFVYMFRQQWS
mgnify:FL=1